MPGNFVLPPREKVGYLDPEIAGEGMKVLLDNGEQVSWTPPPPKPVMPDWSQIKSIRHYFGRTGHQVYPAWLYHPTEQPRIVKNAEEAGSLGVCYRHTTNDERARFGVNSVWDYADDSKWRAQPYEGSLKFDPLKPGQGKTFMATPQNPVVAQNALLEALIPTVTAAVVAGLKSSGAAGAPAAVDPAQWEQFLAFQAWQKSNEAIGTLKRDGVEVDEGADAADSQLSGNALNALNPDQERALWEAEAQAKGIKIDGRWSLERLRSEVEKAA